MGDINIIDLSQKHEYLKIIFLCQYVIIRATGFKLHNLLGLFTNNEIMPFVNFLWMISRRCGVYWLFNLHCRVNIADASFEVSTAKITDEKIGNIWHHFEQQSRYMAILC